MIDELLQEKKISRREANIYELFELNDVGKKWLKKSMFETFMDCPPPNMMSGEMLAYADGRRSIIRDILSVKERIDQLLKEKNNNNKNTQTGYINE